MKSIYQKLVTEKGFSPAQKKILSLVKEGEVLEIGASSGFMTREFVKTGSVVDVVEKDPIAAKMAGKSARSVFVGSIEDQALQQKINGQYNDQYDVVICADVLEHLIDPEKVLLYLKTKIKKTGRIIISLPNIAFWDARVNLLKGRFDYQESGLMDKTHLRFYTYRGFQKILQDLGFKIINVYPTEGRIPLEYTLRKIPLLGSLIQLFKPKIMTLFPNLTLYHYVIQAKV